MANHKSSKKRIRSNDAKRTRNRYFARTTRNAIKKLRTTSDKKEATSMFSKVVSMVDKLAKINVIHNDIVSDKDSKVIDPITILAEAADKTDYQGIAVVQIVLTQLTDPQKADYK